MELILIFTLTTQHTTHIQIQISFEILTEGFSTVKRKDSRYIPTSIVTVVNDTGQNLYIKVVI